MIDTLIVGLGNYKKVYSNTRHNIGFRILDYLIERIPNMEKSYISLCDPSSTKDYFTFIETCQQIDSIRTEYEAFTKQYFNIPNNKELTNLIDLNSRNDVGLIYKFSKNQIFLYPLLGMNNSGISVKTLLDYYGGCKRVLIILDDIGIPFGEFRLKDKVKTTHHNGLKSILSSIDHSIFCYIVRIGIGKPDSSTSVLHHVLGNFSDSEEEELKNLFPKYIEPIKDFINGWEEIYKRVDINGNNTRQQ